MNEIRILMVFFFIVVIGLISWCVFKGVSIELESNVQVIEEYAGLPVTNGNVLIDKVEIPLEDFVKIVKYMKTEVLKKPEVIEDMTLKPSGGCPYHE